MSEMRLGRKNPRKRYSDIPRMTTEESFRFYQKIKRAGPDECWEWQASTAEGYGRFKIGRKVYSAHRIAFEDVNGPVPYGMLVTHDCDNRRCCNPVHLCAGTHRTNAQEMADRGRMFNPRKRTKSECLESEKV